MPKIIKQKKTNSSIKKKTPLRNTWEGFEDYRDKLYAAAHLSIATDIALEKACSTYKRDPLSTAISGLTQLKVLEENPSLPTAKEAVDNSNALLEIVRIQGELVGKYNFDSYFIQHEYESIISPGSVVPGYKPSRKLA